MTGKEIVKGTIKDGLKKCKEIKELLEKKEVLDVIEEYCDNGDMVYLKPNRRKR
jgi:hypothetical protein